MTLIEILAGENGLHHTLKDFGTEMAKEVAEIVKMTKEGILEMILEMTKEWTETRKDGAAIHVDHLGVLLEIDIWKLGVKIPEKIGDRPTTMKILIEKLIITEILDVVNQKNIIEIDQFLTIEMKGRLDRGIGIQRSK